MSAPFRRVRAASIALVAALALAGCAGSGGGGRAAPAAVPAPPREAAPEPRVRPWTGDSATVGEPAPEVPLPGARPRPGYDRRVDPLAGVDASALRGRRIALDPGHGGRFPGSIGVRGLTEAEVNLGVALHLWGLLVDAGAEVFMTRTADRDFPEGDDVSLRADLASRSARANAWGPEVFLSIHHNADPGRRNDVNELQTYYRFDDPGASLELGNALHRRLKRNLGIDADRVIPGNFYVIRNADAPAVLGESSYLTNPDVEARLALGAKQRLEAEAFFLGLVDYFARGVPRVIAARTEPATDVVGPGGDARDASERPWIVLEADRLLDGARLEFDGAPIETTQVAFARRGAGGIARFRPPAPLTDGRHVARWTVRASGGGWSKTVRDTFDVDLPVARVAFAAEPPGALAPGQVVALTLRALDRHGRPVADTLRATFGARVGAVIADSLAPRAGTPGEARAYARITGGAVAALSAHVTPGGAVPATMAAHALTLQLVAPGAAGAWTTGFARGPDGRGVAGAVVQAEGDTARARTNADGFFALPRAAGALGAAAPGYVTAAAPQAGGALGLVPIGGGALFGRRIALDPGGGGADSTGLVLTQAGLEAEDADTLAADATPGDTTATAVLDDSLAIAPALAGAPADSSARRRAQFIEADANLRVARALREYLEAAGAVVTLTRDRPESLSAIDRLRRTEIAAPERVVVLSHRAPAATAGAGHYFSSTNGKALARRIAARLESRGLARRGRARVGESASYVVAQTAAVAVSVNLPNAAPLYVDATRGARRLRDEAYAIYLALLEDLGSDPKTWQDVTAIAAHGEAPEAGVPVTLDGRWTLITDAKGRARFDGLPAGARLTVTAAGDTARAVVTTPARGDVRLGLAAAR